MKYSPDELHSFRVGHVQGVSAVLSEPSENRLKVSCALIMKEYSVGLQHLACPSVGEARY